VKLTLECGVHAQFKPAREQGALGIQFCQIYCPAQVRRCGFKFVQLVFKVGQDSVEEMVGLERLLVANRFNCVQTGTRAMDLRDATARLSATTGESSISTRRS
jgi:hypothetical protein